MIKVDIFPQLPNVDSIAEARIFVVGDLMLDQYWFGSVDRISPEAPVPVVFVNRVEERLGGAGNVAANIRALGANACLLSVIGEDAAGKALESLLEKKNIDTVLRRDPSLTTIVKLRVIGRSQQLLRADFESPPGDETLSHMVSAFSEEVGSANCVVFSDYGKGSLDHISKMITSARNAHKLVLVDPKGIDYSRYSGASLITPNKSELTNVIGKWQSEQELFEKAHELRLKLSLGAILLTRSEEGMTLFDEIDGSPSRLDVQAQAKEVFDVTGAGDTVIAVMAVLLACGLSIRQSAVVSNKAASIVVGKFGTATLTYEELMV